ncbi:MAG: hypothetical protein K2W92_00875 [Alphaproteobacteria bacterium]|nr:hypothetical protein [Alphaproteobacteria bacterium]
MKNTVLNFYTASPYWRWWTSYYYSTILFHQLLPTRENHDTFKHLKKTP